MEYMNISFIKEFVKENLNVTSYRCTILELEGSQNYLSLKNHLF